MFSPLPIPHVLGIGTVRRSEAGIVNHRDSQAETAGPQVSLRGLAPGMQASLLPLSSPPDCSSPVDLLFPFIYLSEDDIMGNC